MTTGGSGKREEKLKKHLFQKHSICLEHNSVKSSRHVKYDTLQSKVPKSTVKITLPSWKCNVDIEEYDKIKL